MPEWGQPTVVGGTLQRIRILCNASEGGGDWEMTVGTRG